MFKTQWRYEKNAEAQDAIWFYGDRHIGTACLEADGLTHTVDIYCDGETRYNIPYLNADGTFDIDNRQVIRYAPEWHALGVHTDTQLETVQQEWYERGVEIHTYNSWFDLWVEIDGVSIHLDCVTNTQDDCEAAAEALLQEVASHGGWKPYLKSLGWDY